MPTEDDRPSRCPRCQSRMLFDDTDGEVGCLACGHRIYLPSRLPDADACAILLRAIRRQQAKEGHEITRCET